MTDPNRIPPPPRSLVIKLAAEAGGDLRPASKAIQFGSRAVRGQAGERLARAMRRLGIPDPNPADGGAPNAPLASDPGDTDTRPSAA